ncbi:MAG: hypothetical protein OXG92_03310 [Chloroflexi bacterium]|nr:hypothetical protein [Chloroflexota bacterium]MCY3582760.1 hypothetical protein [Chloroflexota bacterium]MCY3715481.1 hypothetical protein [Chloroflexota bacterium]MDE2650287.1 hypothetical protein [Chloroflexota bacterium]MXX51615.1 hypothetical protein [Chloroflexota bacterium]
MSQGQQQENERSQRRRQFIGLWLPFLFVLLLMLASVAAVLILPAPEQVALVTDVMLTLLVLCPATALLFALLIGAWALVFQLHRWRGRARSPLRRLEALTAAASTRVDGWLGSVDSYVLAWAVRLAPVRSLLTLFDAPQENEDEAET